MSPACRTPNGAIPPTHHPSHGPDRHQRRITRPRPAANAGNNASGHSPPGRLASCTGPRPVACPPGHRPPGHTPPPNGGFCTIRRTATACRRRVAPLMLQFPPHTTPATAPRGRLASCTGPRPVACPPGHRSPSHTPPPNGGFCTIRRIATACRRRVAPLMLQFPHSPPRPRPRPPPATANRATPRRERRQQRVWPQPTRPPRQLHPATTHPAARSATAHRPTPRHPTGGFAPLDASLRRVAGVSHP